MHASLREVPSVLSRDERGWGREISDLRIPVPQLGTKRVPVPRGPGKGPPGHRYPLPCPSLAPKHKNCGAMPARGQDRTHHVWGMIQEGQFPQGSRWPKTHGNRVALQEKKLPSPHT